MFKKIFIDLCNERKEAPSAVCVKLGLSNAAFSKWTDESIPRRATLQRMADYFGVSIDRLLGKEPKPTITAITRESKEGFPSPVPDETDIVINVPLSALTKKLSLLDDIDREKVESYTDGLLAAEKYQEPTHLVKIAARAGGGIREVALTESQIEALKNLPEVPNLDDKK